MSLRRFSTNRRVCGESGTPLPITHKVCIYLLTPVLLVCLLLIGGTAHASAPHKQAVSGYATQAEILAEIAHVDPNHEVIWQLTINPAYSNGADGIYGVALPWYDVIMLKGDGLPLFDYKSTIVHEWSHWLQWKFTGATITNLCLSHRWCHDE